MKKSIVGAIVVAVAVVAFWAGTYYQSKQVPAWGGFSSSQMAGRFGSPGGRQGGSGFGQGQSGRQGDGTLGSRNGQINLRGRLDKISESVVTFTNDAIGSQKADIDSKTIVNIASPSSISKLKPGANITVRAKRNSDGTFNAINITQLAP